MAHNILVVSEEFMKRVFIGLGELPSKFAHSVILDFEAQLGLAQTDVKKYVAMIEEHLMPHKAAVVLQEAKDAAAKAEKAVSTIETAAKEVAADVAAT